MSISNKGLKALNPYYETKRIRSPYLSFEMTCIVGAVSFIAGLWVGSWIF